jgi:hypothetical protein
MKHRGLGDMSVTNKTKQTPLLHRYISQQLLDKKIGQFSSQFPKESKHSCTHFSKYVKKVSQSFYSNFSFFFFFVQNFAKMLQKKNKKI